MSISLSKWPMLPTMALSFIFAMCSTVMMLWLPVAVMKMSASSMHVVDRRDLVAFHRRLQRADRIDFRDDDARALAAQRLRAALADFAEAEHDGHLAAEHHVGRPRQAVRQRVAAAVDVVELALGHRVVDVDGGEEQRAGFHHLIQPMHAGRRLFADAADRRREPRPARLVLRDRLVDAVEDDAPLFGVALRLERRHLAGLLELRRPCAPPASRRRRRRRSASGRCRPATRAPDPCTTSIRRASRPSTRTPASPSGSAACRRFPDARRRPRRRRDPASRRCCTTPSARRRRARRASR